MFTQTVKYAFQMLGYLRSADGQRCRGEEVAQATGVPANYTSKILNQLRKHGIVESRKGWGGGFVLRRAALRRPIREVVAIFEGPGPRIETECAFGRDRCDDDQACPLHPFWEKIRDTHLDMLTQTSIGDLTRVGR